MVFFQNFNLLSQEIADAIEVLVLTNTKSNKTVHIESAKRVKIWFNEDEKISGRLMDVRNDLIMVDNQLIELAQISEIRIDALGTKLVGGTISVGGIFILGAGTALIGSASSASGCLGPVVATITGIFIVVIGAAVTIIGIPVLLVGKKFDCTKNWQITTALAAG